MNIGIDIDDTLTYLTEVKKALVENYIKRNNLPYKVVRTDTHLFREMVGWPKEINSKFWDEEADKMMESVPAREHASEVIKKLRKQGHKIFIITSRTKEFHKDPYALSYNWLIKNEIEFDELLVGYLDKTEIVLENNIDVFIDDMPKTLNKLDAVGVKTIMISNPHNEKCEITKNCKVVHSWKEIENELCQNENNI